MDVTGAALLVGFAIVLAFNQVVIKVNNDGFQPAFQAGLRSAGALVLIWAWMTWKTQSVRLRSSKKIREHDRIISMAMRTRYGKNNHFIAILSPVIGSLRV